MTTTLDERRSETRGGLRKKWLGSVAGRRPKLSPLDLNTIGRISWWVFGVQFLVMAIWSEILYSHFSLTSDATIYLQAAWSIAHGNLSPIMSNSNQPFWRDHFTLISWPLAPLDLIWPHALNELWAMDLSIAGTSLAAFRWILRIISKSEKLAGTLWPPVLGIAGMLVLVADPWQYTSMSFDIHMEVFGTFFVVMAAFDFSSGRIRRAWLWIVLTLCCGDVSGTWVIGLGLSAAIVAVTHKEKRRTWGLNSAGMIAAGAVWAAMITAIGANLGSAVAGTYSYLVTTPGSSALKHLSIVEIVKGILTHPSRALGTLWSQKINTLANIGPSGWFGVFTPWTIGVPAVIFLENGLRRGPLFTQPGFQSLPIYSFGAVGIVTILCKVVELDFNHSWIPKAALAFVSLNALLWSVAWMPRLPNDWMRVSSAQAAALAKAEAKIPTNAETLVSEGVEGRFAERPDVAPLVENPANIPVRGNDVWFVVAPNAGVESMAVDTAMGVISTLAGPMHAELKVDQAGIWEFEWPRPPGLNTISFQLHPETIGAWTATAPSGSADTNGPEQDWSVQSTGNEGYLVAEDYWTRPTGLYQLGVSISVGTTVNVEVDNASNGELLARRQVPPTDGIEELTFPLDLKQRYPRQVGYAGWGLFRVEPVRPVYARDNVVEIRVWSPEGGQASVYSITLVPLASNAAGSNSASAIGAGS